MKFLFVVSTIWLIQGSLNVKYPRSSLPKRHTAPGNIDMTKVIKELKRFIIHHKERCQKDNRLQEIQQNMTALLESIQQQSNTKIATLTDRIDQLLLTTTPSMPTRPSDCEDLPKGSKSGIYKIYPAGEPGFNVYCEMDKAGGGWAVLQRRFNGQQSFYLDWKDYKKGFGDLTKEFWLGYASLSE